MTAWVVNKDIPNSIAVIYLAAGVPWLSHRMCNPQQIAVLYVCLPLSWLYPCSEIKFHHQYPTSSVFFTNRMVAFSTATDQCRTHSHNRNFASGLQCASDSACTSGTKDHETVCCTLPVIKHSSSSYSGCNQQQQHSHSVAVNFTTAPLPLQAVFTSIIPWHPGPTP